MSKCNLVICIYNISDQCRSAQVRKNKQWNTELFSMSYNVLLVKTYLGLFFLFWVSLRPLIPFQPWSEHQDNLLILGPSPESMISSLKCRTSSSECLPFMEYAVIKSENRLIRIGQTHGNFKMYFSISVSQIFSIYISQQHHLY